MNPTLRPMLAHNALPEDIERMLEDPDWVMQPKVDGNRVLIEVRDGKIQAFGRNGQVKISNVKSEMLVPFEVFPGHFVFDGEVVSGIIYLFDLPIAEGILETKSTFTHRYDILTALVRALDNPSIQLVPVAYTEAEKRTMLELAEMRHGEGVMFRHASSRYQSSRTHSLLKHKFVKTIDCVVMGINTRGRDSATLALFDRDDADFVIIGQASTIGKNKLGGGIRVGDVVEVKFLYVLNVKSPRLYQPRIVQVRTDKAMSECTTDQLIGTATDKAVKI